MDATTQIQFRGMPASVGATSAVREALRAIEGRVGTIDRANVTIGPARPFRVTLDLAYRHHRIFVVREAVDLESALRTALTSAEQQMIELKRRLDDGDPDVSAA